VQAGRELERLIKRYDSIERYKRYRLEKIGQIKILFWDYRLTIITLIVF
jgi:hypothetical protein